MIMHANALKRLFSRPTAITQVFAGICVALLGVCVMFGWHTGNRVLMQVSPSLVPMVYNSALCLLFCGAALLVGALRFRLASFVLGALIFTMGVLTLIEYATGVSLGIDELAMPYYLDDELPFPGRMALSTALCFAFAGAAFFLANTANARVLKKWTEHRFVFAGVLGAFVFAMGTVALTGYLMNMPTAYGWRGFSRMAAHGAISFLLVGAGLVAAAWERGRNARVRAPRWLPLLIGLAALTVTFNLYLALSAQERNYIARTIDDHAAEMERATEVEIREHVLALERMAERWQRGAGTTFDEWRADASRYVSDFEGYKAIEWVDATYRIRWIEPLNGNEAALNRNLAADPAQLRSLEAARGLLSAQVSRSFEYRQDGRRGMLLYVALTRDEQFDGYMVGAVRFEQLLNAILPEDIRNDYAISIFDGDREIYRNDERTNDFRGENEWQRERVINLSGVEWRARESRRARTRSPN